MARRKKRSSYRTAIMERYEDYLNEPAYEPASYTDAREYEDWLKDQYQQDRAYRHRAYSEMGFDGMPARRRRRRPC